MQCLYQFCVYLVFDVVPTTLYHMCSTHHTHLASMKVCAILYMMKHISTQYMQADVEEGPGSNTVCTYIHVEGAVVTQQPFLSPTPTLEAE